MFARSRWPLLALLLTPSLVLAVEDELSDAGVELRVANPGDEDSTVIRELDVRDEPTPVSPLPTGGEGKTVAVPTTPSAWDVRAAIHGSFRFTYGGSTPFQLGAGETPTTIAPLTTRLRVSPEIHLGRLGVIAEADAATGAILGTPSPNGSIPPFRALELRKLYAEYTWASGAFRVGQQTAHWGLGVLTNDGSRDAQPGDFGQQHFGALTYRALILERPFFLRAGLLSAVEFGAAADLIVRDTLADYSQGSRAFQGVFIARVRKDELHQFGLYAVYRNQTDGAGLGIVGATRLSAFFGDLSGTWQFVKRDAVDFTLGAEVIGVGGSTQTDGAGGPRGINQWGGALKADVRLGSVHLLLDAGFATGGFSFDRDYKVGLIFFDQVLAYQSAFRGIGTRGSVNNAVYLFPRAKYAMAEWLDLYGGPLFVFAPSPVGWLGGPRATYLGTEVDVGLQARWHPIPELLLTFTGEAGLFGAGDAYRQLDGLNMRTIVFGRLRVGVSL